VIVQTRPVPTADGAEIRRAGLMDADDVGVLTERVYRAGGYGSEEYAPVLRDGRARVDDAIVFVATVRRAIVGTVTLALPATRFVNVCRPDEAEVRMLAVAQDARGRGIADALMGTCERHAQQVGLTAVVLSTEPEMHAAHRLYRRRGYRRVPERDWSAGRSPLLVYRKDLGTTGPGPGT
jgi:ribosomal protein S18 acetylase RimI-like enzyme